MVSLSVFHVATTMVAYAAVSLGGGTQLLYQGTVSKLDDSHEVQEPAKTFDLMILLEDGDAGTRTAHWFVDEVGAGTWHWSERFGRVALDDAWHATGIGPSLLYKYGESSSIIPVALPFLNVPVEWASDANWRVDDVLHRAAGETQFDGANAWKIDIDNRFGRKRQVVRRPDGPLVLKFKERIFMGRGEEHELKLTLVDAEVLSSERFAALSSGFKALEQMRDALDRPQRTESSNWSASQRKTLATLLPDVVDVATGALTKITRAATQDLELQSERAIDVAELVKKYEGLSVEPFSLDALDAQPVSREQLLGKVTVLHFWEYRDSPLKEPYGQVGYLDFLREQRRDQGLQVFGVAVDGRLGEESTRRAASTGIRKLKSFMNLGYPVLLDDGSWIKTFGDPRLVGAQLPLFIVVGPDARIAHYHAGFYQIDRERGLKALDDVVTELLTAETAGE